MAETRKIVVLGASFGGLSAAHYLAKHVLPQLQQAKDAKYELHIVDQSTHFWWRISAPRAMVSVPEMKHSASFAPIMDGFKQYTNLKDSIHFHHASIESLDSVARTVSLKGSDGDVQELKYYALVIATGTRSQTPLTTLQGAHTLSTKALDDMNERLTKAQSIIVGGGGPVAVETAGELATHLGGKPKITLISSSSKLLPKLRQSLSDKAQKQLEKVGVTVKYGLRIESSDLQSDGKTGVKLTNGEVMLADVYIPAVGVTPNTEFLPTELKQSDGYVKTNAQTLRVDDAGPRVYAVGDVAGVDKGGVLNLYSSLPIAGANMRHDLFAAANVESGTEKTYQYKDSETQVVPVGAKTGVGAFNGWQLPGFAVSMIKGKDYMVKNMPEITQGTKWAKA